MKYIGKYIIYLTIYIFLLPMFIRLVHWIFDRVRKYDTIIKLGCKKEIGQGITRIWGALGPRRSRPSKVWETVRLYFPKYGESAPLGASRGSATFFGFTWLDSQNWPVIPPLNIAIIPWRKLGRTVLIIKAISHLRVQYQIQLCIQSCAGVNNRL